MAHRYIMRIELTGPAKQKVGAISDRYGMTQVSMLSRLVEWFASQNSAIQSSMIGPAELSKGTAKAIMKKMADGK